MIHLRHAHRPDLTPGVKQSTLVGYLEVRPTGLQVGTPSRPAFRPSRWRPRAIPRSGSSTQRLRAGHRPPRQQSGARGVAVTSWHTAALVADRSPAPLHAGRGATEQRKRNGTCKPLDGWSVVVSPAHAGMHHTSGQHSIDDRCDGRRRTPPQGQLRVTAATNTEPPSRTAGTRVTLTRTTSGRVRLQTGMPALDDRRSSSSRPRNRTHRLLTK